MVLKLAQNAHSWQEIAQKRAFGDCPCKGSRDCFKSNPSGSVRVTVMSVHANLHVEEEVKKKGGLLKPVKFTVGRAKKEALMQEIGDSPLFAFKSMIIN